MRTASSANTVVGRARRDQRAEVEHEHALARGCGRTRRRARRAGSRCRCSRVHRAAASAPSSRGLVRGRGPTTARRAAASLGSVISARPISTRRPTPRLSASTGRSATASSPSSSSVASARCVLVGGRAARGAARPSRARRRRCGRARRRGSARAASCPTNSSMRWNVRADAEPGPAVRRHAGEVRAVEA